MKTLCPVCTKEYSMEDIFHFHNFNFDSALCPKHQIDLMVLCGQMGEPAELLL